MNPTPPPDRRYVLARIAHVTGDVAWWVFVVARLMVEIYAYGLSRRYVDYSHSLFTTVFNQADRGWTSYTPQTDHLPPAPHDSFLAADVIAACAIGALAVVITTAVIEAIAVGHWRAGIGTIAAPIAGAAVILFALHERTGGFVGGQQLNTFIAFVLVLAGVACRQVWSQALAPRRSPST